MSDPLSTAIFAKISSAHVANFIVGMLGAMFGALTHALIIYRKGELNSRADFWRLVFVSFFVGCFVATIAYEYITGITVGKIGLAGMLGGYMSLEGMAWGVNIIQETIARRVSGSQNNINIDKLSK